MDNPCFLLVVTIENAVRSLIYIDMVIVGFVEKALPLREVSYTVIEIADQRELFWLVARIFFFLDWLRFLLDCLVYILLQFLNLLVKVCRQG